MQCTVDNKSETELPGMGRHRLSRSHELENLDTEQGKNTRGIKNACSTVPKHVTRRKCVSTLKTSGLCVELHIMKSEERNSRGT